MPPTAARRLVAALTATLLALGAAPAPAPTAVLGQANSTWSRSLFFRGYSPTTGQPLRPEDLTAYATTLHDAGIQYAYLFSGPFQPDGSLPDWATSATAKASIERMKAVAPGLKILPWVGGIQGKQVHLQDPAWRAAALASLERLAALPIDGFHLDFELVLGDDAYLNAGATAHIPAAAAAYTQGLQAFHREARARFPKTFLSSVVVSTASQTKPWKLKHSLSEVQDLAGHVDQLAFLYYDTAIKDRAVYEQGLDEQLAHFQAIKTALGPKAPQLLLAIGTFVNEPALRKYRDLTLENIPGTLALVRRRLAALSPGRQLVDGLAVYCEWQTEPDEWRQIRAGWTSLGGAGVH